MNKEMKKIIARFLFRCTVLICLLSFLAGVVTVKQRSEFNSYFTPYAVLTLKNTDSEISLNIDEKEYSFDFSEFKCLSKYRSYLYFTPFSCVVFFFESVYNFFSSFKG